MFLISVLGLQSCHPGLRHSLCMSLLLLLLLLQYISISIYIYCVLMCLISVERLGAGGPAAWEPESHMGPGGDPLIFKMLLVRLCSSVVQFLQPAWLFLYSFTKISHSLINLIVLFIYFFLQRLQSCTFLHVLHKTNIAPLTFLCCYFFSFFFPHLHISSLWVSSSLITAGRRCRVHKAFCLVHPACDLHFSSKHPKPCGKREISWTKIDILGHFTLPVAVQVFWQLLPGRKYQGRWIWALVGSVKAPLRN